MKIFFFTVEGGMRAFCLSRGLGDVYKKQHFRRPYWLTVAGVGNVSYPSPPPSLLHIFLLYTSDADAVPYRVLPLRSLRAKKKNHFVLLLLRHLLPSLSFLSVTYH